MKKYIVEIDATGEMREAKGAYCYSKKLFDKQADASQYAVELLEQYGADNIYLVSVYEAKTTKRYTEYDGAAPRIAVYRASAKGENTITDEHPALLTFYTRKGRDGSALMGAGGREWNTATNTAQ